MTFLKMKETSKSTRETLKNPNDERSKKSGPNMTKFIYYFKKNSTKKY